MEDGPTLEGESAIVLDGIAAGVDDLEAIAVFLLGASHLYASWHVRGSSLRLAPTSEALRQAYLAAEQASLALGVSDQPLTLTIETEGRTAMVTRVRSFGIAAIYEPGAPLGFARMAHRQIAKTLEHELPYQQPEAVAVVVHTRPTQKGSEPAPADLEFGAAIEPSPDTVGSRLGLGERIRAILRYLEENASDPHLVRTRVALRSGLGQEALNTPDGLPTEALLLVETAAEDILGLEHGKLTEAAPL